MKRLLSVLGVLVLVGAVAAVVVWQRAPQPRPSYVVLQHADASELWRSGEPETPLVRQVVRELGLRASLSLDQLRRTGAVVVTTIDRKAQTGATAALREKAAERASVTAVDPASGAVRAYASGTADFAGGVVKQPGSTFFPFSAVAALQEGKPFDQADPQRAVKVAQRAGVPEFADVDGTRTRLLDGENGGLRPLDLASGYATFAAEGVHRDAHFVTHVADGNGATLYQAVATPQPAFDRDPLRSRDIANQVTAVLRADPACAAKHLMACRPGVWPDSAPVRHAWMAGYTPDLAVAVFAGGDEAGGAVDAGLPKAVWEVFLDKLRP